jgi:hypothetical protein
MTKPCRTLQLLQRPGPPALLVSLPANDLALARAALDGGAEGLKVHINLQHAAAGVQFGPLADEAVVLKRIVALGLPVGIVPGDETTMTTAEDIRVLAAMGMDFLDAYLGAMPAWMLAQEELSVMAAVGHDDVLHADRLSALAGLEQVRMVEASIVSHEGYGKPLSVSDLCDYTGLAGTMRDGPGSSSHGKPVIVPTQRSILPEDVAALAATGVRGLLIGAIVTGRQAESLRRATERYREALQQL